jgi:hypothetical protein
MATEHGLQLALDLFEAAEALMRQNLRREFPNASEEEIERKVVEWLQDRPGAPHGDAPGKSRSWSDFE